MSKRRPLRHSTLDIQYSILIQVIQRYTVIGIERPVLTRTDTRQHPGIGIRTCWCSGNMHGAYRRSALIHGRTAATVGTVHIIGMPEANAMTYLMRQHSGYSRLWLIAHGI